MAGSRFAPLLVGAAGALLAADLSPVQAQISGMLTPSPGVLCDPAAQRCYDAQGLSLQQTRERFGSAAERQAERSLRGEIPPRQFQLSNGVFCDVDLRSCWEDGRTRRNPARALSQQLFTTTAGGGAGVAIHSPQPGVLCDAAERRCYGREGLSPELTRSAYGNAAARLVERDLQAGQAPRQFLLSNGVLCDLDARNCWEDGWRRRNVATVLRSQLFPGGSGAQSGKVTYPRRGVLCDTVEQRCYNRRGLSASLTGDAFGTAAERQVARELNAGQANRSFLLSNGTLCDLDARQCWQDGWRRRAVATEATDQLFGRRGGAGGDDWNRPPSTGTITGQCRLSRGYQTLFSGRCELRQAQGGYGSSYQVILANGNRYGFENRRGVGFRIDDGTGSSWPVQFSARGSGTVFRWADMTLETSQGSNDNRDRPDLGRTLTDLLEGLFR